jgi:hypothetical protein
VDVAVHLVLHAQIEDEQVARALKQCEALFDLRKKEKKSGNSFSGCGIEPTLICVYGDSEAPWSNWKSPARF